MNYPAADKYRSMLRSFDRMKRINTNSGNAISNTDARDATEEFFNQCYHFKDWLRKDPSITLSQNVEHFITGSRVLALAADFCNSFKHAALDRKSRSGDVLEGITTHMTLNLTQNGFVGFSRLEITIGGKTHDALELATACVEEWDNFLRANQIAFPPP